MKFQIKKIEKITADCYLHEVEFQHEGIWISGLVCWGHPLEFEQLYTLIIKSEPDHDLIP